MDYLAHSQEVRRLILTSEPIMKTLREHLRGHKADFIGGGSCHKHYRIGMLESGLWVASRESFSTKQIVRANQHGFKITFGLRNFNEEVEKLEEFCQKAQSEYEQGTYIVTSFCVGVRYKSEKQWRGLLLLEDLTQGGNVHITSEGDNGTIEGAKKRVLFDLSMDKFMDPTPKIVSQFIEKIVYFDPAHIIEIQ